MACAYAVFILVIVLWFEIWLLYFMFTVGRGGNLQSIVSEKFHSTIGSFFYQCFIHCEPKAIGFSILSLCWSPYIWAIKDWQLEHHFIHWDDSYMLMLTSIYSLNEMPDIMRQMPPLPVKVNEDLANTILPHSAHHLANTILPPSSHHMQ